MSHLGLDSSLFFKNINELKMAILATKSFTSFLWVPETSRAWTCRPALIWARQAHTAYTHSYHCHSQETERGLGLYVVRLRLVLWEPPRCQLMWGGDRAVVCSTGCLLCQALWSSPAMWLNVLCWVLPGEGTNHNTAWVSRVLSWGVASFWLPPPNGALPAFQMSGESCESLEDVTQGAASQAIIMWMAGMRNLLSAYFLSR